MVEQGDVEMEEVKIGSWNSQIPTHICTNKEIFKQIFSTDTFFNALSVEQQEKLTKLLPPEIASNADLSRKTIEDLFNGSLTTFSQSPLFTFYDKLERGLYDPVVVETKNNILKEWKKDTLRQMKSYHMRLLEDIVVSRQKHLNKILVMFPGNTGSSKKQTGKSKKQSVLQNASSGMNVKSLPSSVKASNKTNKDTAVIPNNNSRKRKIKEENQDVEVSSSKKSAIENGRLAKVDTQVSASGSLKLIQAPIANPSVSLMNPSTPTSVMTSTTATVTTAAKIVLPSITDSILSNALTAKTTIPVSTSQVLKTSAYTSPTLSSPILASQLQQSPQVSVKVEDTLNLFQETERITLNYQKTEEKSSEDELETSSDEFEAINPTIGFGTNVTATISGIISPTPVKSISPVTSQPTTFSNTLTTNTKFVSIPNTSNLIAASMTSSQKDTHSSPVYLVSTKGISSLPNAMLSLGDGQTGRIIQLSKEALELQMNTIKSQTQFRKEQTIVDSRHIKAQPSPQTTLIQSKCIPNNLTFQPSEIIRIPASDVHPNAAVPAKSSSISSGIHCISTSTGKSLILHSIPNSAMHNKQGSGLVPSIGTSLFPTSLQLVTTQPKNTMVANTSRSIITSSNSTTENDDLASLTSLGTLGLSTMNINIGSLDNIGDTLGNQDQNLKLDIDGIDKIDDLSVLDGNPFDSIPNLSDELDGLDLDLVDGLCDFEGLLSDEKKYPSFFSLIRDVLCSTRDHRMNLICLEKTIRKWASSPGAALNPWFLRVSDWNTALVTALNFLAGNYQDVHPEDFVPYIEYKYKTKYYQWIGAGRDGDNNLTPLCSIWMDNLDKLPTVKKIDGEGDDQEEDDDENEDSEVAEETKKKNKRPQTPPPPRCWTDWSVRPSTEDEKMLFRKQERARFDNPHKAFTYTMHGYESVVGPVKGVYSSQVGMTNKARGHSLLIDDRPPYVTILALVRDAVARLPNGEGTRSEICEMLRDSAFLAPDASSVTLNSVVSGALDRLHYERDPCVRYDSHKKSWIYLHRDRTQEQFERLHHNRSYTKSTKSRNNTSRKSRRAGSKTNSQQTTTTVPATTAPTFINSTAGSSITTVTPSTMLAGQNQPTPLNSESSVETLSPRITIVDGSVVSSGKSDTSSNSVKPSTNTMIPTIRLNAVTEKLPTGAPTPFPTGLPDCPSNSQLLVPQGASVAVSTSSSCSIAQPNSAIPTRPLQIQTLNLANLGKPTDNTKPNPTIPNSGSPQNQFMLASPAVLRLSNALRLSNLRQPSTGLSGNVRVPQHRILLTRGSIPGQTQSQGILLGQTSNGQTVILSTTPGGIGGFQAVNPSNSPVSVPDIPMSADKESHSGSSVVLQTQPGAQLSSEPRVTQAGNAISAVGQSMPATRSVNVATPLVDNAATKVVHLNIAAPTTLQSAPVHLSSSSSVPTVSTNVTLKTTDVLVSTGTGVMQPQQRQSMGYTIATVRGNTIMALPTRPLGGQAIQIQNLAQVANTQPSTNSNLIVHQQETTNEINSTHPTPMTSPIILRSVQGDLMLPGHIALGKGVQGIKLIPVMGNKTVLAKIIPPTVSTSSHRPSNPALPILTPSNVPTLTATTSPAVTVGPALNTSSSNLIQSQDSNQCYK